MAAAAVAAGGGSDGADDEDPACAEDGDPPEKDNASPLSIEELQNCNLMDMAKDKFKSRLLQRSLMRGGPEAAQIIFSKAEPHFLELVHDQYGNYLSQKILEVSTPEEFNTLFCLLKGHLEDLAQDVHGTRAVQKVVEQAINRSKVQELLEALPGDLLESLARSVTGFHVIIKMLESLPSKEADELLDRLCGTAEKALSLGGDQWGCCVLKKCVDRAEGAVRQKIIDSIIDNIHQLVQDPFGNYVVQHLILTRSSSNVTKIIDQLRGRMFELSLQKFSSNVLEKCLLNSSDKDRNKIINEILNPPGCKPSEAVRILLFHQFGNYVFQQSLEVAKDPQFSLLIEHSKQHIQEIVRNAQAEVPQAGNLAAEHARRLAMKLVKKYPALHAGLELPVDPAVAAADAMANGWGYPYFDPMAMGYGGGLDGGFGGTGGVWPGSGASGPTAGAGVYNGYPYPPWDPSFGAAAYSQSFAYPPPSKGSVRRGGRGAGAGGQGRGTGGGGGSGPPRKNGGAKADGKGHGRKGKQAGGGGTAGVAALRPVDTGALTGGAAIGAPAESEGDGSTMRVGRIVGFWPNYSITYEDVPAGVTSVAGTGRGRSKNKAKGKAMPKKPVTTVAQPVA